MKFQNRSEHALILGGYVHPSGYPLTIGPGEIVDADPERLKALYTPADLKNLIPVEAPKPAPTPAPAPVKPVDPPKPVAVPAPVAPPAPKIVSEPVPAPAADAAPDLSPAMLAHINGAQS